MSGSLDKPKLCSGNCVSNIFNMLWGCVLICFTLHDQTWASDLHQYRAHIPTSKFVVLPAIVPVMEYRFVLFAMGSLKTFAEAFIRFKLTPDTQDGCFHLRLD